ncbi:Redoxin-domain-containing protein [Lasiosphaeris hirsuta]|uniref:Redoxin-domain-containing protein n=1 Tax=Lasiosphaeris hirsuta TaxID=260670 RepID=A0AA40B0A3_9PEZI|nr:Redoxin-domain-containing protein [Lasiosphaeris hirsuta]
MSVRHATRALRPLGLSARAVIVPRTTTPTTHATVRTFHATRPAFIKVGDPLPGLDVLVEGSPGNNVNLAEEANVSNNMIVIGVPAAFSPACSASHIPSYINHPQTKEFDTVAVVSVNDVFVMKAWGDVLDPDHGSGIRFLADPTAKFTQALDLAFDGSAIFGGDRSKRYAIVVENGRVKSLHVEPDNTGTNVSLAEHVLGKA